ncbi:Spo0E family sporulation regulatory protein-aspartic acid phosphatase [Clostridium sp. WILCCON 0269]|uniref:Spo0E family sporulation regulatory protein-aspartic acid phosphatase n=1 Tax=Candidatus Clostridium eludens TaxID=3381663 RepID=A0ABW8SPB0_9CLOT
MKKARLILKKLERQRELLEREMKQSENLSNPKIIIESQKLDLILNEYMREINENQYKNMDNRENIYEL